MTKSSNHYKKLLFCGLAIADKQRHVQYLMKRIEDIEPIILKNCEHLKGINKMKKFIHVFVSRNNTSCIILKTNIQTLKKQNKNNKINERIKKAKRIYKRQKYYLSTFELRYEEQKNQEINIRAKNKALILDLEFLKKKVYNLITDNNTL